MPWTKLPESQGGKSQDLGRGTDLGQGLRGGQSAGGGGLPCCPASSAAAPVRRGLVRTSGQAEAPQGKSTPCPFPLLCGVGAGWSDRWGRTDWLVASASRDPRICPPGAPPPHLSLAGGQRQLQGWGLGKAGSITHPDTFQGCWPQTVWTEAVSPAWHRARSVAAPEPFLSAPSSAAGRAKIPAPCSP